jgi:hypothetical protein
MPEIRTASNFAKIRTRCLHVLKISKECKTAQDRADNTSVHSTTRFLLWCIVTCRRYNRLREEGRTSVPRDVLLFHLILMRVGSISWRASGARPDGAVTSAITKTSWILSFHIRNSSSLQTRVRASYCTTGALLPISSSWRQATWDSRPVFFFQLNTYSYSPYVTSSLTRRCVCRLQLLQVLASAVILGFESHILLSHFQDFKNTTHTRYD